MNIVVTIGRNIEGLPMSFTAWENYQERLGKILRPAIKTHYFAGLGGGTWEGQAEEAYTLIGEYDKTYPKTCLRLDLRDLARDFGQDAIALTFGDVELIHQDTSTDPGEEDTWTTEEWEEWSRHMAGRMGTADRGYPYE